MRAHLATLATALLLAACDGRPLLYQIVPSEADIGCLKAFHMIDTANKGQITRAETDAYFARRFAELDRNHNGILDETEAAGMVPIFGFKTGPDLIFHLDLNGDGKLTADEFAKLSVYLFTRDENRDGILTLAEVKTPPGDDYVAPSAHQPGVQAVRTGQ